MDDDSDKDSRGFWYSDGDYLSYTGYYTSTAQWIAEEAATNAYPDVPEEEARQLRMNDGVAAAVAVVIAPDLFITHRKHLLSLAPRLHGTTVCDARQALGMLGLYLRAQHDYTIWLDPDNQFSFRLNKGLFFTVGAVELLPEPRWGAAVAQYARAAQDESLSYLLPSLTQRMKSALQARDEVHWTMNRDQRKDVGDDAISSLEVVLVMLMGALDVTARVTHKILGLSGSEKSAGWTRGDWIKKLDAKAPNLAKVVASGSDGAQVVKVLSYLRNSVHGEAMHRMGMQRAGRAERSVMSLPRAEQAELVDAIEQLGGREAWGVHAVRQEDFYVDPGVLTEQMVPRVANLLNEIKQRSPVERLPNVRLRPADLRDDRYETTGGVTDRFGRVQRACVRALLGL